MAFFSGPVYRGTKRWLMKSQKSYFYYDRDKATEILEINLWAIELSNSSREPVFVTFHRLLPALFYIDYLHEMFIVRFHWGFSQIFIRSLECAWKIERRLTTIFLERFLRFRDAIFFNRRDNDTLRDIHWGVSAKTPYL